MAAAASAQSDRGTVTGTVADQTSAVIPGARIVATNVETSARFETRSTETGNYTLPQLPAGIYQVVRASGNQCPGRTDLAYRCGSRRRDCWRHRHGYCGRPTAKDGKQRREP